MMTHSKSGWCTTSSSAALTLVPSSVTCPCSCAPRGWCFGAEGFARGFASAPAGYSSERQRLLSSGPPAGAERGGECGGERLRWPGGRRGCAAAMAVGAVWIGALSEV